MSLIDAMTAEQRAELHRLTRLHDEALILCEQGGFIYARRPDHEPYVWSGKITTGCTPGGAPDA